jgi:MFS family permease
MRLKINISVNRVIELLLLLLFILNMAGGLFGPLYAVFVTGFIVGAKLKTVGFAAATYAIVKSLLQIPIARRIDKKRGEKDDFYVMLAGSIVSIVYPLSLMVIKHPWQLYAVEAVNGAGGACLMAAYYGIFSRHIDKGSEGFEWSLFSVWGLTISVALGSVFGGIIADSFGLKTTFAIASAFNFAATLILVILYPSLDDGSGRKIGRGAPQMPVSPRP